ncbi:hypothetical protein ABIB82_006594 [Bradyrhizobium sp. i1.8.4]
MLLRADVVLAPPNVTLSGVWIGPHSRMASESAPPGLALLR